MDKVWIVSLVDGRTFDIKANTAGRGIARIKSLLNFSDDEFGLLFKSIVLLG